MHPCHKARNKSLWGYTKTEVCGSVSFGNLTPFVDPALLNSSYKVCLWKCLCSSGRGVVGQPVRVCWLGRVTTFICLSCSTSIQGLSAFYPGADFQKTPVLKTSTHVSHVADVGQLHAILFGGVETCRVCDHRRLLSFQNLAKNRK